MIVGGVDGCKKGWIMVKSKAGAYSFGIYENFQSLIRRNPDLEQILIDIPIGLASDTHPRTIDQLLRRELKTRSSTVFTPACRAAVYLDNYEAAKKKNIATVGKSLSIQSYNISPKIREIDNVLSQKKQSAKIFESHPELCFKYLNEGKVVVSKKSKPEGLTERLELLSRCDSEMITLYKLIEAQTLRKYAKKDDIVDAMCLCLANKLGRNRGLQFLRDENPVDARGIEMKIAYYNPSVSKG